MFLINSLPIGRHGLDKGRALEPKQTTCPVLDLPLQGPPATHNA